MQRMRRFSQIWDRVGNRGYFGESAPLLWIEGSAYKAVMDYTMWLHDALGRTHSISLNRLTRSLFDYLTEVLGRPRESVGGRLARDVSRRGTGNLPGYLQPWKAERRVTAPSASLPRQARHQK